MDSRFLTFIFVSFILHIFLLTVPITPTYPKKTPSPIEIVMGGMGAPSPSPLIPKASARPTKTRQNVRTKKNRKSSNMEKKVPKVPKRRPKLKRKSTLPPPPKPSPQKPLHKTKTEKIPLKRLKIEEHQIKKTENQKLISKPKPPNHSHLQTKKGASISQKGVKDYFSKIRMIIEKHKHYPRRARVLGREGMVQVSFTIEKNGTVRDLKIKKNSGFKDLDKAALKTIAASSPFPPPPDGLETPLNLSLAINFRLDR
ncbi:Ferric siderophore transport system, periplasmic binding protein TonB [Dissulfuribacter thermophilus]|uniref:Ferric siderophore transport system, periplasmic binding protein TonB n=2 Tax=Dissulfuribacter thermophilus TaxID=1156395 RepID=A0A1B9F5W3_9BACT|nr:Ferric siderophore transport system, periplasmic binding protein TonB [Dissulfuribacter thermophilus]